MLRTGRLSVNASFYWVRAKVSGTPKVPGYENILFRVRHQNDISHSSGASQSAFTSLLSFAAAQRLSGKGQHLAHPVHAAEAPVWMRHPNSDTDQSPPRTWTPDPSHLVTVTCPHGRATRDSVLSGPLHFATCLCSLHPFLAGPALTEFSSPGVSLLPPSGEHRFYLTSWQPTPAGTTGIVLPPPRIRDSRIWEDVRAPGEQESR